MIDSASLERFREECARFRQALGAIAGVPVNAELAAHVLLAIDANEGAGIDADRVARSAARVLLIAIRLARPDVRRQQRLAAALVALSDAEDGAS